MSDKDLDKLFKNKLEELRTEPSARAWDEVSSEIHTRRPFAWWYVAAAVVLLVSAVVVLQFNSSTGTGEIAATDSIEDTNIIAPETSAPSEDLKIAETDSETIEKITDPLEEEDNNEERIALNEAPAQTRPIADVPAESTSPEAEERAVPVREESVVADLEKEVISVPEEVELDIIETTETMAAVTGTTRSFSIEQFSSAEMAEVSEESDSEERGLKKVWNLLKNVKEPSNGIGDLREMKNGLLAFGKSKKETENQ